MCTSMRHETDHSVPEGSIGNGQCIIVKNPNNIIFVYLKNILQILALDGVSGVDTDITFAHLAP